jgi:lipoprotein signal peptidase
VEKNRSLYWGVFCLVVLVLLDLYGQSLAVADNRGQINPGISGGLGSMLPAVWWIVIQVGLLSYVGLFLWRGTHLGWWMMGIGGLSNLVSRLHWGGLVDYLNWGIFVNNISDIMIFVGMMIILWKKK